MVVRHRYVTLFSSKQVTSEPLPDAPGPDAPGADPLPEPPPAGDPFWEHLKTVNDVFYDQVKTADQKAAYLFTFMVAFLLASAEGRDIFALDAYRGASLSQALVMGVMAVVLPRNLAKGTSLFWGAWPEHGHRLLSARQDGDMGFLFTEYARNVENLAMIARRKFRLVGLAFRGLMVLLACYVLLLAVSRPG